MNELQFRQKASELGYGDVRVKDFGPNEGGDLHTHDFSAFAMVSDGELTLVFEDEEVTFGPGESCEVSAGTKHCEKTGRTGATILIARK